MTNYPKFSIAVLNKDFSIKSVSNSFLNLFQISELKMYFENIPELLENIDTVNQPVIESSSNSHFDDLQHTLSKHVSFFDILPQYDNTMLSQAIKLALRGEKNHWEEVLQINTEKRNIKWTTYPKKNTNATNKEDIEEIILIGEDITEYKSDLKAALQTKRISNIGHWEVDLVHNIVIWSDLTRILHEVDENYVPTLEDGIYFYEKGESRDLIMESVQKAIKDGTPWDVEVTLITAKNNKIWVRSKGEAESENGKCVRLIGIFQDITPQIKKRRKSEELLQMMSNQNARLTNFAHIVSHNLHSHSNNMESLMHLMQQEKDEKEKQVIFKHLLSSASNLKETVTNLTKIVEIQNNDLPLELINVNNGATNVIQSISSLFEKEKVTIINEIDTHLEVKALPAYFDSMVLNLLTNTIKYKSPNKEAFVRLSTTEKQQSIVLSIEDNGLGIDLKLYGKKLFGMYKTFHNNEDAKGIGLFITKNQIESMGGKITVESQVGEGTTFHLEFLANL
jgi:signal transduction histidine kinase